MEPDFQPNGSPIPKPFVPFAEPGKPVFKPNGYPPGMSPPPKTEIGPINNPAGKPGGQGLPASKPTIPTGKGVRGDNFGRKPIGKPLNVPTPKVPNSGPPVPTVPFLIRKIIEYVLEPQPTSDGTLPDYEQKPEVDDPYPDGNNEPPLDQQECLEILKYPQLQGRPGEGLTQITYYQVSGHKQDNFFQFPGGVVSVIARKTYISSECQSFNSGTNGYRREVKEIGRQTGTNNRRSYKLQMRVGAKRTGDGKFVWDGWSTYQTAAFSISDFPSMPPFDFLMGDSVNIALQYRGTRYFDRFPLEAYPCSEEPKDTQDPNDYDRNQDDDAVACKWKPENDPRVEGLRLQEYEYQSFAGCYTENDIPLPAFSTDRLDIPVCVGDTLVKMLNRLAFLEGQSCKSTSSKFWNIKKGNQATLYAGIPNMAGAEVALPLGCVNVAITFDNAAAKSDKSLRDLKRIGSVNASNQTFVNTMRVWLIDAGGNAITEESLWVPSTLIFIPFRYRAEICKIRMMPKSMTVTFTVVDTGDRWEAKSMPT